MIEVIDKPTQRVRLKVIDPIGLHARPASILCEQASKITDAEVNILFKEKQVNAKSIMGILSLGIRQNDEFEIMIQGENKDYVEESIMDIVEKLIDENIAEEIDVGIVNIDEEVESTIKYLKRFSEEDFVKIISGTVKKYCEIDNLEFMDVALKILNGESEE